MSLSPMFIPINCGDEVDLTSNWCAKYTPQNKFCGDPETPLDVNLKEISRFSHHQPVQVVIDIEARFWPTPDMIGAKKCRKPYFGAHGDEEIPVLIPNTEVKLISGDYTATSGKLARCRII